MTYALVPVKDQAQAKSRLSGVLAPHERRALNLAMLQDVVHVLSDHTGIERVALVSGDPVARLLAENGGHEYIEENEFGAQGLNEALRLACDGLGARGIGKVLIVHSDMPMLQAGDVDVLLQNIEASDVDVVLGPDSEDCGTNAMLFSLAVPVRLRYGLNSFVHHCASAKKRGLRKAVVRQRGIACDVDSAFDLLGLLGAETDALGRHTAELLSSPAIYERLQLLRQAGLGLPDAIWVAAND